MSNDPIALLEYNERQHSRESLAATEVTAATQGRNGYTKTKTRKVHYESDQVV